MGALVLRKGVVPRAGDGLSLGAFLADEVTGGCQRLRLGSRSIVNLCHGRRWNYLGHLRGRGSSTKGRVLVVLEKVLHVRLVIGCNTARRLRIGSRELIIVTNVALAEVSGHAPSDVLAILPSLHLLKSLLLVVMIGVGQIDTIGASQGSSAEGGMSVARRSIGSGRAIDSVARLRIARLRRDCNARSDFIVSEFRKAARGGQVMRLRISKSIVADNMVRYSMIIHTDSLLDKSLLLESVGVDERANEFSVLGWNLRSASVRMGWLSILQGALLLARSKRSTKFSVQQKVAKNAARAPVDAISPASDT